MSVAESLPGPEPRRAKRSARKGPPCRRFTLLDGMIFIVVAAVGFAGCRAVAWAKGGDFILIEAIVDVFAFFLMLLSFLVLIFRLRKPRSPIRRIIWQPGTAACF